MTNGRVHLGLITAGVLLHPGPPLHSPFPIGGCKGGFREEAPAIDGMGGLKLPCMGGSKGGSSRNRS